MKQLVYYGLIFALAMLAMILHGWHFGQGDIPSNTFVSIWFAGMWLLSGIHVWDVFYHNYINRIRSMIYWITIFICSTICFVSYAARVPDSIPTILYNAMNVLSSGICFMYLLRKPDTYSVSKQSQGTCCRRCFWTFLKCCHVFIYLLLSAGAIIAAFAYSFQIPGTLYSIQLKDGRSFSMNIHCVGTKNAVYPTIWIVADAAHGVTDFLGIQQHLATSGRRVCIQDNPGFGGSSAGLSNLQEYAEFYDSMFEVSGMGPNDTIDFVAWGGGGTAALKYTVGHPSRVVHLVFIQVYPDGVEHWRYQNRTGITDKSELESHRKQDYMGRRFLAQLVLSIGIPLPLMPIFVPPPKYVSTYEPNEMKTTFGVQLWKSRFWMSQYMGIEHLSAQNDTTTVLNTLVLPPNIPLAQITCQRTDAQICVKTENCTDAIINERFYAFHMAKMTQRIQSNASFVYNYDEDCAMDIPVSKPKFTADAIMSIVEKPLNN